MYGNYPPKIFEPSIKITPIVISRVVDNIFNAYIQRPKGAKQPLLAQYCYGVNTLCPGKMSQWGSKYLGDQGYMFLDILQPLEDAL